RNETGSYYEGALALDNVLSLAQGGVQRRPGLRYIDTVAEDGLLIPYSFNKNQRYSIFIGLIDILIYRLGTDGIYSRIQTLASPYTSLEDVKQIKSSFSGDVVLLVHPDYPPKRLFRGASDNWSISNQTFDVVPKWNFDDADSPAGSDCIIYFTDSGLTVNSQLTVGLNGFFTDPFTNTENNLIQAVSQLPNIHTGPDNISVVSNPTERVLTLKGKNQDEYIVTTYVTSGPGTYTYTINTQGSSKKEPVWSATRGYPAAVAFFAGRLWLGGMRSVPATLYGSRSLDYFNFDEGTALDHQAIGVGVSSNQINPILHIVGGRNLQVLTEGGEYGLTNDSLTPTKANLFEQTNNGSSACRPASVQGQTFFVRADGKSLIGFVYQRSQQSYVSYNSSILNPSIIKDPQTMTVLKGLKGNDATYIIMVNNDGTLTILNVLISEGILSFTTADTQGEFLSVSSNIDDVMFLVKRNINGADEYYVEQFDESLITDSAITSPTSPLNASRLIGETVDLVTDGAYRQSEPASASMSDPYGATPVEVGLRFETKIVPMPATLNPGNNKAFGDPIRISRVSVLTDGNGIRVQGKLARHIETDSLQGAYLYQYRTLGWRNLPTLSITQNDPAPITILSVQLEVNI
ncbi:MAG: hypothetical protein PUP46_07910, partial [Endozoicomonas sp. (ex Botrylloides leachii)]|nr:hypothetical protein [Endozoicomonas sp. (ex Botrylloides leachii)]